MKEFFKKKPVIICSILILLIILIGIAYARATGKLELVGTTKTGSVKIENINLEFKKQNGERVDFLEPADINQISWTAKNIGTSAVLTRHSLEIYWEDVDNKEASNSLLLYPANITNEDILKDYEQGDNNKYQIETELLEKNIGGSNVYGIKYLFVGDTLDGTDMKGKSSEENYNLKEFTSNTDDKDTTLDTISYKLLVNPKLSYLYQGKKVVIRIVTEAMQYTDSGKEEWSVVDIKEI
ncbi:MAG: hypothetical protein E7313_03265 [Clostridiales bacterium]|nr:hypothetical protein [Clostridiales bacterium]